MIIEVTISGTAPLIVNRFHEDAQKEATSGVHSRREALSPQEDARSRLYHLDGTGCYVPAEWLRQAIIDAAKRHKIGRRAATTDVAAAILIVPFAVPLTGEWEVDTRPVVIPTTGGRILRHRPIFSSWSLTFQLQLETDLIDEPTARRVVDDAGKYVGIGDFRPAKRGPYGRFRVDKWVPRKE